MENQPEQIKEDTLKLHQNDNVSIVLRDGKSIKSKRKTKTLRKSLSIGDKIALKNFVPGHQVIKYGFVIGTVTHPIKKGEWVHTHNLKSNYLNKKL